MTTRQLFFEDMAKSLDYWVRETSRDLFDENADLSWVEKRESFCVLRTAITHAGLSPHIVTDVLTELLRGVATSFLTIIDGGTELAEYSRIRLVDEAGNSLGEGLHEDFVWPTH